jgi:hypothetical protein
MRVDIPEFKTKSELHAYLRSNVDKLIKQKKSLPIKSDIFEWGCLPVDFKKTIKDDGIEMGMDEIEVNNIANLSGWCDSYMDVCVKDCWNKTIKDKSIVYHLKNHDYSTDDIVGKDAELYTKMFALSYFGIESEIEKAQALMMRSIVPKEYDKKTYYLYRDNQIKQHSIGYWIYQMKLCIDSGLDEDAQYKANWDKYYPMVINKDKVDNYGYFWALTEIRILENSCVLFGANEHTGNYSTSENNKAAAEAPKKTEPSVKDTRKLDAYNDLLKKLKT